MRQNKTPSRKRRDAAVAELLKMNGDAIQTLAREILALKQTIKTQGEFLADLSARLDRATQPSSAA